MPVLVEGIDSFLQAKAFFAAEAAAPSQIGEFLRNAYYMIQQQKADVTQETTWLSILGASGISPTSFGRAWGQMAAHESEMVEAVASRQLAYQVEVTPTVVIDGRYVVTPENTQGNEELFKQLLNGMVSKAIGVA